MIIDVKKYLLFGTSKDLNLFFNRAQERGFIEFINPETKKSFEVPAHLQVYIDALKILKKQPYLALPSGYRHYATPLQIARRAIELKGEVEKLSEKKRYLKTEISRVAVFGDFSLKDIESIEKEGRKTIQFFCSKPGKAETVRDIPEIIYIGQDNELEYFIAVNSKPTIYPDLIEMRIEKPVGELKNELKAAADLLQKRERELKELANFKEELYQAFLDQYDQYELDRAINDARLSLGEAFFTVEAWIPSNKFEKLKQLTQDLEISFDEIAIEPGEMVPTYMENKGVPRVGEDLVHIYDTPAATDKDPSGWVFWAFALFFSIIINDGGYGLLFLGFALYLKWKFPDLKGSGKRFLKLFLTLSVGCIIWGVLTASFFGLNLNINNPLRKYSLTNYLVEKKVDYHFSRQDEVYKEYAHEFPQVVGLKEPKEIIRAAVVQDGHKQKYPIFDDLCMGILMEISLLIGIIHVALSLLRNAKRNWAACGWVVFMIGGYLFFPSMLDAVSMVNFLGVISVKMATMLGKEMVWVGIVIAMGLALIQNRLKGLGEIANMVQVFADVLSYLRLYALGIAGSILAETFNGFGVELGLFIGFIAVFAGHSINILLAIMGGVIHGLRLNFLEWYHYSFEGGGRLFRPLRKLKN